MAALDHAAELDKPRRRRNVSGARSAAWHLIRRYPLGAIGALIILLFVALAVFAGVITSFRSAGTTNSKAALAGRPAASTCWAPISWGATCIARIVYGARISLMVSASVPQRWGASGWRDHRTFLRVSMAAGSISSRSASSTSCSRCRCW
jgi:peptide/nickel transport system permease protein